MEALHLDPIRLFLVNLLLLYSYLMFGRIVFSWFPGLDWFQAALEVFIRCD